MIRFHSFRWLLVVLALAFMSGAYFAPKPTKAALARLEAAKEKPMDPLKVADCASYWVPKGCVVSGVLCLAAAAAVWRMRRQEPGEASEPASKPVGKWDVVWLGLVMLQAVFFIWPRMGQSIWNDEQMSIADSIVGEVSLEKNGLPREFRQVPWVETVFGYITPNNHMLYSITARLVHTLAPEPTGRTDSNFNPTLLRLPALAGGLAALLGVWLLGRRLHSPMVGWLAVALLALTPWWVRYSSEARGYGMLLGLITFLLFFAVKAVRTGQMRAWLGFGLLQFLCLYTWPLAIHFVFWLNAGIVIIFGIRWRRKVPVLHQVRSWLSVCLLGAALLTPLVLPLLPQLKHYLLVFGNQVGDATAPGRLVSVFLTGRTWDHSNLLPVHYHPDWAHLPLGWLICGLMIAVFLIGVAHWWRRLGELRWLLLAMVVAPVAMVAHALLTKGVFYDWYLSPFAPGMILLFAMGVCALLAPLLRLPRPVGGISAAVVVGLYAAATWAPNQVLRSVPAEPLRAAAEAIHAPMNPAPEFIRSTTEPIIGVRAPHQLYLPTARRIGNAEQLAAAMEDSRRSGRTFYVVENQAGLAALMKTPLGLALADPTQFRRIWSQDGFYPDRPMAVYEWIPDNPSRSPESQKPQ